MRNTANLPSGAIMTDGGGAEKYYERIMTDGGFRVLRNEKTALNIDGRGLSIIGLDEMIFGAPDYSLLSEPCEVPTILLTHEPDAVLKISEADLPFLTLSGHSHGGDRCACRSSAPRFIIFTPKFIFTKAIL